MANATPKISNFAATCNLLSQYVKEKGTGSLAFSSLGKADTYGAGKADTYRPTMMSLLPGVDVSADTKDNVSVPMELFPQRAGVGLNGPAADVREPEKAQLTIFYGGKVLVFDNFPADKASDLMQLASKKSGPANDLGLAPPVAAPTVMTVTTEAKNVISNKSPTFVSSPTNSLPVGTSQPQKPTPVIVSNLPIARKASLHRFLEKRKDRISAKAPYQANPSKDSPVDSIKAEESQPWLGLKPMKRS